MENVLKSLDGVVNAKADNVEGLATITYDPARITPDQMVEAINTKTFFQANLPHQEGVTPEASGHLKLQPFITSSVLILLVGVITWRAVVRWQVSRVGVTEDRQE